MSAEVERIVKGLDGRQVRFIRGIASQDFAPACRWEDRARQKLRRLGVVTFNRKEWRWELTDPLGLAARAALQETRDHD